MHCSQGVVWPASPNFLFGGTISHIDNKLGLVVQTRAGVVLLLFNLHSSDESHTMQCNAMRCDAMRCDAMRCDAMRCDAMRYNVMQCNAMQYNTAQYVCTFILQYNTVNAKLITGCRAVK